MPDAESRKKEQIWINSRPGFKDQLFALARDRGYASLSAMIEDVLEKFIAGQDPPSHLDGAAEVFLAHLDAGHRDLIRDLCTDNVATPSDYLLTYIRLAYDRGEASSLEPELRRAQDGEGMPRKGLRGEVPPGTCAFCGKTFEATRQGQKYCPDPDDGSAGCGRKATLRELHAHRVGRKEPDSAFGPNQRAPAPQQQDLSVYLRAKKTVT
ncbi:MAG TPA: hypothetical protein DCQ64_01300 [Candidatus Rokubacteria bacterium]|nr:hypothetical protein [Candidatus Rokubacteria bacterium]